MRERALDLPAFRLHFDTKLVCARNVKVGDSCSE